MDVRLIGAGYRKPHRLGSGRQQQPVVGDARPVAGLHLASSGIDADDFGVEPQFDGILGVKRVRPQRQPILRRAAGKIVLRQVRPVDRRRAVIAEHHDAAAVLAPAQHLGRGKTGGAAADDDDLLRRIARRRLAARSRLRALLLDEDAAVALLDSPARHRAQGRRARRLPGAQIEAGVVPGTAHALADNDTVGERAVIVAAMGADREHLGADAHEQHLLVADMADKLAVDEVREGNALGQIRAARRRLLLRHGRVLRSRRDAEELLAKLRVVAEAS